MQRTGYFIRKAAFGLVTLAAVLTFNFLLFRIVPGDPVAMIVSPRMRPETRELIRTQYGLDKPVWLNIEAVRETGQLTAIFDSQYFLYLDNLAHGNLGVSFRQKQPVSDLIAARLGPTLLLMFTGQIVAILIGTVLGIVAAWKARSKIDTLSLGVGLTMFALPAFWLGIVLLTLAQGVFPAGGYVTIGVEFGSTWERWLDIGKHLVLPATTLALPLVTIIALNLGVALGGMIEIETIFSWPGLGRLMFDAIGQRDYPVLQGTFLLLAVGVIVANFLADLTYVYLDPRVKA